MHKRIRTRRMQITQCLVVCKAGNWESRRRAKIRERKGRKEGEKKKKKKKGVRFVSFCRVELDGRACTHCGKHPMVVAYLFARTISLDNVVRWGCNDLFLDHLQQL